VTVLVAAAGSGGTLGGAGMFLKGKNERVKTVRAVVAPGEEIPAGRTLKQVEEIVTINYPEGTFDYTVPCGREAAFMGALSLGKQIFARPGPTSGEAYQAALAWVAAQKAADALDASRNARGLVHVVFICPDSIELYAERVSGSTNYEQVR
jgi:cysteine synthase